MMKSLRLLLLPTLLTLLTSHPALTTAQTSSTQVTNVSPPFNLVLHSHNRTLNGTYLGACHEGAAIEALCALDAPTAPASAGYVFRLNTTSYLCFDNGTEVPCTTTPVANATIGEPGILWWGLPFTGPGNVPGVEPQSVQLTPQGYSSNLAFAAIWFPEASFQTTEVAFDAKASMNLQDSLRARKPSAPQGEGTAKAYYRWYMCEVYFTSYLYNHLMWMYGDGEPFDAACQKVDVRRVFV